MGLGLNLVPKKLSVTSIGLCRFSLWSEVTGLLLPQIDYYGRGEYMFWGIYILAHAFFLTDVFQIFECSVACEKANMILDRQ